MAGLVDPTLPIFTDKGPDNAIHVLTKTFHVPFNEKTEIWRKNYLIEAEGGAASSSYENCARLQRARGEGANKGRKSSTGRLDVILACPFKHATCDTLCKILYATT